MAITRSAWLSAVTVLTLAVPSEPCSYEIPALRHAVQEAELVVIGTVESVVGDSVDAGLAEPLYAPRSATFAVERVLKGSSPSAHLELQFPASDIIQSSCGPPYMAYLPGTRFALLLGQPTGPSTYAAPGIDPWRMRLSPDPDYTDTPLYQYLTQIAQRDVSPVRATFQARGDHLVGQPLAVSATVTNDLDHPLQLWLGRPPYGHAGLGLWLQVEGVSPSSYDTPADELGVVQVAPRTTVTVDLADVFTIAQPGLHGVEGYLWVPNGAPVLQWPPEQSDFYDILHGLQSSLWSYRAETPTVVDESTWAQVKTWSGRRH